MGKLDDLFGKPFEEVSDEELLDERVWYDFVADEGPEPPDEEWLRQYYWRELDEIVEEHVGFMTRTFRDWHEALLRIEEEEYLKYND